MEIKTKYNIGDRIWVVYESQFRDNKNEWRPSCEVSVYDTYIDTITQTKDGVFYQPETDTDWLMEEDIILYENTDKLLEKIKELMNKIDKREEEEN